MSSIVNVENWMKPLSSFAAEDISLRQKKSPIPKSKAEEKSLKGKALGNSSIVGKERFFIRLVMKSSDVNVAPVYRVCFVSRNAPFRMVMEYLSNLSSLSSADDDSCHKDQSEMVTVCEIEGYPWQVWNVGDEPVAAIDAKDTSCSNESMTGYDLGSVAVCEVLLEWESLTLLCVRTAEERGAGTERVEALAAYVQKRVDEQHAKAAEEQLVAMALAEAVLYRKGDIVRYTRSRDSVFTMLGDSSAVTSAMGEECSVARVVGVHHDDFPRIYYSLQFVSLPTFDDAGTLTEESTLLDREIQTDGKRMTMLVPYQMLPVAAAQGGIDLRVFDEDNRCFTIAGVSPTCTLAAFRAYASQMTMGKCPISALQSCAHTAATGTGTSVTEQTKKFQYSLNFKNKLLKNENKSVANSKLVQGSKVQLPLYCLSITLMHAGHLDMDIATHFCAVMNTMRNKQQASMFIKTTQQYFGN